MGDVLIKMFAAAVVTCALFPTPAQAAILAPTQASRSDDDAQEKLFTIKDPRIAESSGLAVSPTHPDVYYTHNDSGAGPVFYALGPNGRTKATFRLRGAESRDWEAMAATKDPKTGRGVLWFADIGDNMDGAWPDVSIYRVMEPTVLKDATLPAVRYRFRYSGGGRNAEGIMINPRTGRLYVVSKEFSGSVYIAPKQLRTSGINILRKVGDAPIMATDAAYAPDGSSYVIRTYFSATLYRPSGEMITRVSMPELHQAESIAYAPDGKALLTGSEGLNSPVYRVPIPSRARPVRASPSSTPSARPVADTAAADRGSGLTGRGLVIWIAAALGAVALITFIARRTR
ncbi:hypothetical protein ACIBHX_38960 [Nonomuraea sp. NPDC050536]|uniref:hypothetical protein n=1 Tax=Nonomuraea sp. NPDC050536 TaxID=3364366 RepID=UPI0037CCBA67